MKASVTRWTQQIRFNKQPIRISSTTFVYSVTTVNDTTPPNGININ